VGRRKILSSTQELVDFTLKVKFGDLPDSVVRQSKRVFLDDIGCALGGHVTEKAKIVMEFVKEMGGEAQASIIGGHKASWALAAFANGELINALDYDAVGPLVGHVTPYVTPSCLTIGEKVRASGKELITAIALAHEIGGRVASTIAQHIISKEEHPYYEDSPRSSFTATVFGAVAGACKLLQMDAEGVANAFGIAGASTPVPATMKWEYTTRGNFMVKYNCWPGWIAQLATVATLLADKGFTGDTTILDGEWGFWKIVGSPFFNLERLAGGLGKTWHLEEMKFKAYPCCGCNHTGIDAINKIMEENKIEPDDIEEIIARGTPYLLYPCRSGTELRQSLDTQFVNAYIFALAVYQGRKPGPDWQSAATAKDARISKLMKKVRVQLHPRAGELMRNLIKAGKEPSFRDTIVEVTAKGKKFTAEVKYSKDSPANPMTDNELKEKFRNNAYYSSLRASKVDKIIEMINDLEKITNITELTQLLTT
jgi:2-methylcitrate dehydratase PrpD